jgi:hypothetical protein
MPADNGITISRIFEPDPAAEVAALLAVLEGRMPAEQPSTSSSGN